MLQWLGEASSASWGPLLPRSPKPPVPVSNARFERIKPKQTVHLAFCFCTLPCCSNSLTCRGVWGVVVMLFPCNKLWLGAGITHKVCKQALDTRWAQGLQFVAIGALNFHSGSTHSNSYEPLGPRWLYTSVPPQHLQSMMRYKKAITESPLPWKSSSVQI